MFAMDGANRIIRWNKACEELLGFPARAVLGKPCYEVLQGRDANGNDYCQRSCPVARQARVSKDHPVSPFELTVRTGQAGRRRFSTALFALSSYHPALSTLVHVLRPRADRTAAGDQRPEPLQPVTAGGEAVTLTSREVDVLRGLGRGLTAAAIARSLFISEVTVRNHVARILLKFRVHTKLAAVAFAHEHHLL